MTDEMEKRLPAAEHRVLPGPEYMMNEDGQEPAADDSNEPK